MSVEPKRPSSVLLKLLPGTVALATLAGTGAALHSGGPDPRAVGDLLGSTASITAMATVAEEKGWLEESFPEKGGYLPAPPGPPPCPLTVQWVDPERASAVQAALRLGNGGIHRLEELHAENSAWLTGLPLGRLYALDGRFVDAESLYAKLLARGATLGNREKIELGQLAVDKKQIWEGPSTPELVALIYLQQAYGYAQIKAARSNAEELWWTLKSPIALGKLIVARKRGLDKVSEGYDLELAAPGCPEWQSRSGISSYDLYNNLIVGYLLIRRFEGTPASRDKEFGKNGNRGHNDPPEENPLFAILQQEYPRLGSEPDHEAWLWAISNAERLLRDRLREKRGYPEDPRLALTLAGLLESAVDRTPPDALPALLQQERELLALARRHRNAVTGAQDSAAFRQALARLILITAGRHGREPDLGEEISASLTPEQKESAALLQLVQTRRRAPAAWADLVLSDLDPELAARLGERAGAWQAAGRTDLAGAVARLADGREPEDRRALARTATAVLAPGDEMPPALVRLRSDLGWSFQLLSLARTGVGAWLVAAAAAGIAGLLASWLALQLRIRRELFTSFYRTEAQQRMRSL